MDEDILEFGEGGDLVNKDGKGIQWLGGNTNGRRWIEW